MNENQVSDSAKDLSFWQKCWVAPAGGVAVGGIVVGYGWAYVTLFNVADPSKPPIHCLAEITRAGLWAGVSAGHAVAVATGIKEAADLHDEKFSAIDWQADLVVKIGGAVKTASRLGDAALDLLKLVLKQPKTFRGSVLKNLVENLLRGWRDFNPSGKNFMLLATVLGKGKGLGAFKEWQHLYTSGATLWAHKPPRWRMRKVGGQIVLEMQGIPEPGWGTLFVEFVDKDPNRDPIYVYPPFYPILPKKMIVPALDVDNEHWFLGSGPTDTLQVASPRYAKLGNTFKTFYRYGELIRPVGTIEHSTVVPGMTKFNGIKFKGYGEEKVVEVGIRVYAPTKCSWDASAEKILETMATPGKLLWESRGWTRMIMSKDGKMLVPVDTGWINR